MERLYYLSHRLWKSKIPVLPRLIMLLIRFLYVSFIPYQLQIGPGVHFGHRMGVVINATTRIGANVKIRQFVTIGGGPVTIADNVQIGAGAKIFGKIHIGNGAVIGANAVVVRDVPPNVTVGGIPAKIIRKNTNKTV